MKQFRRAIYSYYKKHGRVLPWRKTKNPYCILVSEIMLQQTQVSRVRVKFPLFIRRFPSVHSLAKAPQAEIVKAWQGLGYNRRAVHLKRLAQILVSKFKGRIPANPEALITLPGIGKATAGAICAFAFNKPVIFIETNIRSVFIHHFFKTARPVSDEELFPYLCRYLDKKNPRKWYSALMDYGVYLKEANANPSRRSLHYRRQSLFEGSRRQLRGRIIRLLAMRGRMDLSTLAGQAGLKALRLEPVMDLLCEEGLVLRRGNCYTL
ncbi:MAG: A/G-specific adenine glycosylase [Candidatus Omnitrophota bacterium]|nr:MAG: A/G-specific adenine glycosylase [Candidatus Omnitrophota bacterium]